MGDAGHNPFGHIAFDCNSTTYCAVTSAATAATAATASPTASRTHDQVVPTSAATDSPSPTVLQVGDPVRRERRRPKMAPRQCSVLFILLQDHSPIHVSDQSQIVLPCAVGCEDHHLPVQEGHGGHREPSRGATRPPVLCPPAPAPVSVHLPTTIASTLSASVPSVPTTRSDGSSKVIVEAAKTIPIEAQSDLQHLRHQPSNATHGANLEGMKEIDFSMF
jgi:hypothetical protein